MSYRYMTDEEFEKELLILRLKMEEIFSAERNAEFWSRWGSYIPYGIKKGEEE